MKVYRLLLLNVVLLTLPVQEKATSLSPESKNAVLISALKGALSGVGIYAGGSALFNGSLPSFGCPCEQKPYVIAAAIGALTMAAWRYNYSPECYYDDAFKELERISQNQLIILVLSMRGSEFVEQIKQLYVRDSFPLVNAFRHMNYLYSRLEAIDQSLDEVLNSSRTDLYASCYEMQIVIQTIQSALECGLKLIKEEPQFINEYNAQTSIAIQQTQAAIAQAAYSQATAAWIQTLNDRRKD